MRSAGDSPWAAPATVAGFAQASPNGALVAFAAAELNRVPGRRLLDVGCGAARNLLPLARLGWSCLGVDLVPPMLVAARRRAAAEGGADPALALAPMDALPVADGSCDLVVAHGVWNLARSDGEMRRAMAEAARVSRPGAALFVFTFSRHTLPPTARPLPGERYAFTDFSGAPQCFLTAEELLAELAAVGFVPDPAVPLREHNRPPGGVTRRIGPPVIWEGTFRLRR